MVEKDLKVELEFVDSNRGQLIKDHMNKFLLIHETDVKGSFDNYKNAAEEGVRVFGPEGKFLVYQAIEKPPVNFVMEADI